MSGYDQSPDYGGPEMTPGRVAVAIAAFAVVVAFCLWAIVP